MLLCSEGPPSVVSGFSAVSLAVNSSYAPDAPPRHRRPGGSKSWVCARPHFRVDVVVVVGWQPLQQCTSVQIAEVQ